jgi:hypothetical protein
LDELLRLKKSVVRKIGELEDSSRATESMHKQRMQTLSQSLKVHCIIIAVVVMMNFVLQETSTVFEELENRVSEIGSTAILIGDQLESFDKQKSRAQDAKDLVLYFQEFSQGQTARLDLLRTSSGWDGRRKAASIVKRLNLIAKEVDIPAADKVKRIFCECSAQMIELIGP